MSLILLVSSSNRVYNLPIRQVERYILDALGFFLFFLPIRKEYNLRIHQ